MCPILLWSSCSADVHNFATTTGDVYDFNLIPREFHDFAAISEDNGISMNMEDVHDFIASAVIVLVAVEYVHDFAAISVDV